MKKGEALDDSSLIELAHHTASERASTVHVSQCKTRCQLKGHNIVWMRLDLETEMDGSDPI